MSEPKYDLVRERLAGRRRQRGLNLRDAAKEIGVSAPTLSRIERGTSRPDLPTLDAVIRWLGLDRSSVYNAPRAAPRSTPEQVKMILRADENLNGEAADALAAIFKAAYDELAARSRRSKLA